jgi:hypothetical protein
VHRHRLIGRAAPPRVRELLRAAVTAAVVALAGCGASERPAPASAPPAGASATADAAPATSATSPAAAAPTVASASDASAALGKRVRIRGTAENARLGGVISHDDLLVYCLDLPDGWDERTGSEVTVEGVLASSDRFMARTAPDGSRTAGTDGPVLVLEHCTQP